MFTSPYPSRHPNGARGNRLGGLYQQVGVETQVSGADAHQLVALLFDGFMEAVAQARGAMAARDTLGKGAAIQRALRIVDEGLRAGLDMNAGGTLARDLDDLYQYLGMRLTLANLRNDDAALAECARLVTPLRDAWRQIAPRR
jgi:flagellar protein FliS